MGGIECLWLQGRVQYAPSGERSVSEKPQGRDEGVKTPTLVVGSSMRQRKWIVNSGIKLKEELAAWDILLDTQNAWLAIPPDNGSTVLNDYSLTPVIINDSEFVLNDETRDIESIDIELLEAHK